MCATCMHAMMHPARPGSLRSWFPGRMHRGWLQKDGALSVNALPLSAGVSVSGTSGRAPYGTPSALHIEPSLRLRIVALAGRTARLQHELRVKEERIWRRREGKASRVLARFTTRVYKYCMR